MDSAGSDQLGGGFGGDIPAAALADLASALERVDALSARDLWDHETRELLSGLEVGARRIDAARVTVLGQVQRSGLHEVDGHASAKVMVRHTCRLSGAEALRRERQEEALRHLPLLADAYRTGVVGTEQVDLVAYRSAAATTAGSRRATRPAETPTPGGGAPTAPTARRSSSGSGSDAAPQFAGNRDRRPGGVGGRYHEGGGLPL